MTDQNEERAALLKRLLGLLEFPAESPSCDYKEALPFSPKDDFGLKLIRHIIGMANAGGGHLVIGYSERGGKLGPDPQMSPDVAGSYDPTSLSQAVGAHVRGDGKPALVIEKVQYVNRCYPIICINEFSRSPFFCGSTKTGAGGKKILREGALYVRDQHTRTVEVANPAQWEDLISRCVRNRQSEMLDAFGRILADVRSGERRTETSYVKEFEVMADKECASARRRLAEEKLPVAGWFFWHAPTEPLGPFGLKQLRDAAERAARPNTGLPLGLPRLGNEEVVPVENGLSMHYTIKNWSPQFPHFFEQWFLHNRGGFFVYRSHDCTREGDSAVAWDLRVWRIAEALDHCVALYEALDADLSIQMQLCLVHEGLNDVPLFCSDLRRGLFGQELCKTERVQSSWSGSLATLQATRKELTTKLCQELFARFDFCEIAEANLGEVYDEYAKSRAR